MLPQKEKMFRDWDDFASWAAGRILSAFIEEGGKGLRSSVYLIVHTFRSWEDELKAAEKKVNNPR